MFTLSGQKGVRGCDGLTRRDFLRVGALSAGAVGLSLADLARLQGIPSQRGDINCILLFLVGGPSHVDTWDMKPDAPAHIRGPFAPIRTNVPGIDICEHFPRMSTMADRYAILRSVHHEEAPIHEAGHQLMQTGHLFRDGREYPHYGSVISNLYGSKTPGVPPFVVLPGAMGNTGVSLSHGQTAGYLGRKYNPLILPGDVKGCLNPVRQDGKSLFETLDHGHRLMDQAFPEMAGGPTFQRVFGTKGKQAFNITRERDDVRSRYGWNTFGQSCLLARRLVEGGVRLVTVNMFDTVFGEITWDCHADGGQLAVTLDDYKNILCPMFDRAYWALLGDLAERGLLETTLVVAMGEFGRTPRLNARGGRDHWPGCWSILFAGACVPGGQVIGASDAIGAEPREKPADPAQVAATVYQCLGVDLASTLSDVDGLPIVAANPIAELCSGSEVSTSPVSAFRSS